MDTPNTGLFARLRAGLRALTEALDYSGFDYALDRINSADQEIARLKAQNAMDYTPYDYALDRIGALERQVSLLRDELRAASAVVGADRRVEPVSLAENGN